MDNPEKLTTQGIPDEDKQSDAAYVNFKISLLHQMICTEQRVLESEETLE